MYYLYIITGLALSASFIANRERTIKAVKIAFRKLSRISPAFLSMLIIVSAILFLVPEKIISNSLENNNKFLDVILASFIGSVTLMPGPIAYPLCGILLKKGVSYMVLSAFSTTLMMVGVLTYPVEKEYFGAKITIIRNILSFFIVLVIALITGIFFGELL